MKNKKSVLAVFTLLSLRLAVPVFSQSQSTYAHLAGTLTDPSGSSISDAQITAYPDIPGTNPVTAQSSSDGTYSLSLSAGHYHITVRKDSFVTREADLTFQPGETLTLNFRLELAPLAAYRALAL